MVEGEEEAEDSGDAEGGIEDAAGEGHEAVFGAPWTMPNQKK